MYVWYTTCPWEHSLNGLDGYDKGGREGKERGFYAKVVR